MFKVFSLEDRKLIIKRFVLLKRNSVLANKIDRPQLADRFHLKLCNTQPNEHFLPCARSSSPVKSLLVFFLSHLSHPSSITLPIFEGPLVTNRSYCFFTYVSVFICSMLQRSNANVRLLNNLILPSAPPPHLSDYCKPHFDIWWEIERSRNKWSTKAKFRHNFLYRDCNRNSWLLNTAPSLYSAIARVYRTMIHLLFCYK